VSSDSKWQVAPGTEYVFSKVVALGLRYRTMPVDYDKDGLLYEMKVDLRLLAGILNIRRKCRCRQHGDNRARLDELIVKFISASPFFS
jgi:hypothetical protein